MLCSAHLNVPSFLFLQPLNTAKLCNPTFIPTLRKTSPTLTCGSQPQPKRNPTPRKRPPVDGQKPTSRNRRKSSYGTSRRSILKKTFSQEQVTFSTPVPDDPVVGIIGGGMAGLICALNLEKRGVRSTVFDTGVHGLGGRMGTRVIEPQPLIFDHAAQFFTVNDPRFAELVQSWSEGGLVRQWHGPVGELEAGGHFLPLSSSPPRYVAVNGMRLLADSILSQTQMVDVVRPCWISKLEPYNGMWYLSENGKPKGQFDAIVIAHNGKCANRLLAASGLPLIARQMKRLELSSIWALLAAFEDPLPVIMSDGFPFEGAFVRGVDSVSWMANNTKKLLGSSNNGPDCWTFLSTAAYGKRNKVPQENIPTATAEKVIAGMLEGIEVALGIAKGSLPRPFYTRLQLWGAALPANTPGLPCIFDPHGRAGICGDWLLGSSLESAALSGMALANHMADYFQNSGLPDEFAVGLDTEFQPLEGHDIGQFPGMEEEEEINQQVEEYQLTT
ncbi:FAD/NAD(P)-binding domain containing protein [Parasponia andersonii]|uniref:FAD/NAD(P)-binding domain containing protein n=1 Tax=Parasponia andersonii TaxID=3476 RepID=A0A2P5BBF0_PARAD|nr:FAD/NAD(P)-binding domain containing protein [Parasponia andersonii]